MPDEFPIGGPRQRVYDALRDRGFVMGHFGDKTWNRRDGLEVHIYGTGSRLRVYGEGGKQLADGLMAESLAYIDELDRSVVKA